MTQKFNRLKRLPGLSLIEVVVSLAVLGLLAVALLSTTLITQKGARVAKADTQAAKLVQEYVEQIRIYRDRVHFKAIDNKSCLIIISSDSNPDNWSLQECSDLRGEEKPLDNVVFYRHLSVEAADAKQKRIRVTVTWTDSSGTQSRESVTYLVCDINRGSPCPTP